MQILIGNTFVTMWNVEQDNFDTSQANSYNPDALGNSLTVGQRTLNPSVKVRILLPQPS